MLNQAKMKCLKWPASTVQSSANFSAVTKPHITLLRVTSSTSVDLRLWRFFSVPISLTKQNATDVSLPVHLNTNAYRYENFGISHWVTKQFKKFGSSQTDWLSIPKWGERERERETDNSFRSKWRAIVHILTAAGQERKKRTECLLMSSISYVVQWTSVIRETL